MEVLSFPIALPGPAPRPSPPVSLLLAPGLLTATQDELRERSDRRREALVLWAGRPGTDRAAVISHLVIPRFISVRDHLTIPREERHLLANWVRAEQLLIFSDLHTHPGRAFLSPADVAAPFSTRDGFYATVIPDFALGEPLEEWRTYEAIDGRWNEVDPRRRFHEHRV